MAYYEKNGLEYDEAEYEALEHRVFQWRDRLIMAGYTADEAIKLAWRYVEREEHKDPYGY